MAVKDQLEKGRAWALDRWGAFRAESPYFQAKVGLVAAYLVVVALTIFLAPPRADPWTIRQQQLEFGLAFKTTLLVHNRTGDRADHVVEVRGQGVDFKGNKVGGVWRTRPMMINEARECRASEECGTGVCIERECAAKIDTEKLFDAKGATPPYSLIIESVLVFDEDNDLVVSQRPLNMKPGGK